MGVFSEGMYTCLPGLRVARGRGARAREARGESVWWAKCTAAAFTILDEKHHYTGWPICMCTAAVYRLLALSL